MYVISCHVYVMLQVGVYKEEEHELLPRQFFSDEPGFYIEGEFGIRLETILRWVLTSMETHFYISFGISDCL